MQSAPLLTDKVTVDVLQRLIFSEEKPSKLLPIDLVIMTYLVLRRCEDHEIFDSQLTIAERTCTEWKAVGRSLKRLQKVGWVTVTYRGRGRTKAIAINLDTFPAAQPVRELVTEGAKVLVREYVSELQKVDPHRRLLQGWVNRQWPSAQRIVTLCDGDVQLAYSMMGHAFMWPTLKKRARTSVYNMLKIWPMVTRTYRERLAAVTSVPQVDPKGGRVDEREVELRAVA
jgi:hypothetical protein